MEFGSRLQTGRGRTGGLAAAIRIKKGPQAGFCRFAKSTRPSRTPQRL